MDMIQKHSDCCLHFLNYLTELVRSVLKTKFLEVILSWSQFH